MSFCKYLIFFFFCLNCLLDLKNLLYNCKLIFYFFKKKKYIFFEKLKKHSFPLGKKSRKVVGWQFFLYGPIILACLVDIIKNN